MKYIFYRRNPETGLSEVDITVEGEPGKPVTWKGDQPVIEKVQQIMQDEGLDPLKIESFGPAMRLFWGSYFWLAKVG